MTSQGIHVLVILASVAIPLWAAVGVALARGEG